MHDDTNKKKSKTKTKHINSLDPARSDERSWLQSRTAELILKEFPDGNSFNDSDWSRCYAQAGKEWNDKK